jgi:hypothetical protein
MVAIFQLDRKIQTFSLDSLIVRLSLRPELGPKAYVEVESENDGSKNHYKNLKRFLRYLMTYSIYDVRKN